MKKIIQVSSIDESITKQIVFILRQRIIYFLYQSWNIIEKSIIQTTSKLKIHDQISLILFSSNQNHLFSNWHRAIILKKNFFVYFFCWNNQKCENKIVSIDINNDLAKSIFLNIWEISKKNEKENFWETFLNVEKKKRFEKKNWCVA